ncbi:MAG TPA: APC family permease [Verrucomicrobiae bacterium]|nr:APC family permease [Verrucomicrobiae bacterium]
MTTQPHLERRFGTVQATALNMTNMIGVGPFITIPALMSAIAPGGPQAMIGWFAALLLAMMDGMVWAELAAAMPGSGGSYVYLREAFGKYGRLMAFLFIWQFILSGPLEIGTGIIGMQEYVGYALPGVDPVILKRALPVVVGAICLLLLYRKIGSVAKITVTLWVGTLLTVGAVMITGALKFDSKIAWDFPQNAFQFSTGFLLGLGAATRVGLYDYLGYYDVCYIGEEVRNPARTIPRSVLFSVVAVAAIYICINLSIIGIVSWREFAPLKEGETPKAVVSMMMERVWGGKVAAALSWMVIWTAFGSIFCLILGYSRIPYAAARDGNFFSAFGKLHPTKDFPHISLVLIIVIAVASGYFDLMTVIDTMLVTRIIVQFVGQTAGLMLLRKTRPDMERPYRMWAYPLPCIIALAGWAFVFVTYPRTIQLYGVGMLALGIVTYGIWRRIRPA